MYRIYNTAMKAIEKMFLVCVYATSVFIPVALCVAVIFRYFLKSPLLGVDELCSFAFTAMVLSGSAILFHQKRYIVIDAFVKVIKGRARQIVDFICNILTAVIVAGLLYCFWLAIPVQKLFKTAFYQVPKSVYSIALLVIFAYMFCSCVETAIRQIKALRGGSKTPKNPQDIGEVI